MDFSGTFEDFQEVLRTSGVEVQVMEREVSLDVQMAYLQLSKKVREHMSPEVIFAGRYELWEDYYSSIENKRKRLVGLASLGTPQAIRLLQRFQSQAPIELDDWVYLALQECKLVFQASLLDHPPMFISTGLGGSGRMLRFFGALFSDGVKSFDGLQQKVISGELEYMFQQFDGRLEYSAFSGSFVTYWGLVPIDVQLNEHIKATIEESNLLGASLRRDFVLTNVKKLTLPELNKIFRRIKSHNRDHALQ